VTVSNFSSILNNRVNNLLESEGVSITQCVLSSIESKWYVDLRVGNDILIQEQFYTGYGNTDVPTNRLWRSSLISFLPMLYDFGFTYFLNGNVLTITSLTCEPRNLNETLSLNVGINIDINCNNN
jgi:hypothetical protein